MSVEADFRELGARLGERLEKHELRLKEQDEKLRDVTQTQRLEVGSVMRRLTTIDKLADDRHETVMKKLEELHDLFRSLIVSRNGANGHG
jgi:hypothetical protein